MNEKYIEFCIGVAHANSWTVNAEKAAQELAAMQARIEQLEAQLAEARRELAIEKSFAADAGEA